MPPLTASEVGGNHPFSPEELLYRRVGPQEFNSLGELLPTTIACVSFSAHVESAPSVMRSDFSQPSDVLDPLCATKDVSGWVVYFVRVDNLPEDVKSGDGRPFHFFPKHQPEPMCGAHSVIACCLATDPNREYKKPSAGVANAFKVQFVSRLKPITQVYDIASRNALAVSA